MRRRLARWAVLAVAAAGLVAGTLPQAELETESIVVELRGGILQPPGGQATECPLSEGLGSFVAKELDADLIPVRATGQFAVFQTSPSGDACFYTTTLEIAPTLAPGPTRIIASDGASLFVCDLAEGTEFPESPSRLKVHLPGASQCQTTTTG